MKYDPALDGMRALAVSAVIVFHANESQLPGGWMGVDVFFVLSGYLITRILLEQLGAANGINLRRFYARRVLRLAPALAAVLLFTLVCAAAGAFPLRATLINSAFAAGYTMNWDRAFSWFPGGGGVLGHVWSLSIEEQFYLIWPAVLLKIGRSKNYLPVLIVATILIEVFWRSFLVLSGHSVDRTYNGFDTHSDGLLIGCALASYDLPPRLENLLGRLWPVPVLVLCALIVQVSWRSEFAESAGFTVIAILAAWLIVASRGRSLLRRVLSTPLLRFTGRISYGLYLWHYPVMWTVDQHLRLASPLAQTAVLASAAYAAATASFFAIERPFLRLKARYASSPRQAALPWGAMATATAKLPGR